MSLKYKLKRLYRRLHPSKSRYKYHVSDDGVQRHHDPYWYLDDEDSDDWREEGQPLQQGRLHNRTDYELPDGWGQMTPQQKSQWYLSQRVWRQINRQYDAGMWDQWDIETLQNGLTPTETIEKLRDSKTQYRFGDDD